MPWKIWATSRHWTLWGALAAVTFLLEYRFGVAKVPIPHFGSTTPIVPPFTLFSTVLPVAVASLSSLNSDVYVAGASDVEQGFSRRERAGFVMVSALWWLLPELTTLARTPHHGVVSYIAALSVLLPLAWACSSVVGSSLSWLVPLIYALAAMSVGGNGNGSPFWWDWWRATYLTGGAWVLTAAWGIGMITIYVWWGPRRRVSDIDV